MSLQPADAMTLRSLAEEAELYQLLEAADYEACEDDLLHYCVSAWPLLEPGHQFVDGWHLHAIAEHLEAVVAGQLTRLLINVPYRTMKSTLISVAFQPWAWIKRPALRFLTGAHRAELATRDALRSRRLIESQWYQRAWADRFQLSSDQNVKTRFDNTRTGGRISFGMTSGVTGEGADIITIDDPHAAKTAMYSAPEREAVLRTFDQEVANRLNDPKTGAIIIIMQRLHEKDLSGHVLKSGGYEHLCLPAEHDPRRVCLTKVLPKKPVGAQTTEPDADGRYRWDARTEENELLWPARHTREWLDGEKARLGSFGTSGQLQQQPAPDGGGVVKLAWFQRYSTLPDKSQWLAVYQCWDTAQKANEVANAPWVGGTWVVTRDKRSYLVRVHRAWMDYPAGKKAVINEFAWACDNLMRPNAVVIEDKSTGASLLQELRDGGTRLPVVGFQPDADKITRMACETPAIESGSVYLPNVAGWLTEYERELMLFPNSETKDQVDMTSMALRYIRERSRGPRLS